MALMPFPHGTISELLPDCNKTLSLETPSNSLNKRLLHKHVYLNPFIHHTSTCASSRNDTILELVHLMSVFVACATL